MTGSADRNYDLEHRDVAERRYSYEFDDVLRSYMVRSFEPFLPAGRALELGCYKGEFSRLLCERFADVTVVDASPELIEIARQRVGNRARFLCSTFEEAALEGRFDAVFLVHTAEHLDDPVLVLRRIRRWLSDRGRLFLAVPNGNAPSRQIAVDMGLISHNTAVTDGEHAHGHRRTYVLDTLERDARAAGLQVMHRGGVFFKPFANFQFDQLRRHEVIDAGYLDGCYALGMKYPDLCATIYLVCGREG